MNYLDCLCPVSTLFMSAPNNILSGPSPLLPSVAEAAVPVSSVIVVKVRYVSEDNSGGKRYSSLHRFPWYWLKRQAPIHFKSTQSIQPHYRYKDKVFISHC